MKGWYKDYCAETGQFCDQVRSKDKKLNQTQVDTSFEPDCSG